MHLFKKTIFYFLPYVIFSSLSAENTQELFAITKVTNHVYIAHPVVVGRINSTSTILVGESFLTVIESQTDVFMAAGLIKAIRRKISGLPIKYLIYSHFHTDHILGAAAFLKENPDLIIIAHQKTADHILLYAADEQKSWGDLIRQKSVEARHRALLGQNSDSERYFIRAADELNAYYNDIRTSEIVPPNLTFSDSLTLFDKHFHLKLRFIGGGHTAGDIILEVPEEKVLITGDLVHDYEPLFFDADPDSWIAVLEKIKTMDFEYFVGGHGDMHKGKEVLYDWEKYIMELRSKTISAIRNGYTLKEFQDRLTLESFASLQNGYGERIQKFRTSYMEFLTGSLLDAVKDEIATIWEFYKRPGRPEN